MTAYQLASHTLLLTVGLLGWTTAAAPQEAQAQEAQAREAQIIVHADRTIHRLSRHLTGACIEDVNHEIYGGLYSQMIFGESFQEPAAAVPPKGFLAFGGRWDVNDGELRGGAGDGPKLVSRLPAFADGEVGIEVFLPDRRPGNAGLIVRVARPGLGADSFDGYEVSLDAAAQICRLGRHRHNWEHIQDTPCDVPVGQWIPLTVRLEGRAIEVLVRGKSLLRHEDGPGALLSGTAGLRQWQREARYRNFRIKSGGQTHSIPFEGEPQQALEISRMWRLVQRGSAAGTARLEQDRPFVVGQSQRITFRAGQGEWGIENQGLNRWGMHFAGGKPYEGVLWARAPKPVVLFVALESAGGGRLLAEKGLNVGPGEWQRLEFTLVPAATERQGRFAVKLKEPGSADLGYVFLQPGDWGRFHGLPVRRDVAEALADQGITVLRYGGSMVNHPEYRWKKMIGPRDRRPPYSGTWYPHSSNGWGIVDFMEFCEAAGFEYVPAFNMGETPEDMADFLEYAKGPAQGTWGRRRVAGGHPAPYRLRYVELGNEERVDEDYFRKFKRLAEAIWAKDAEVILVVGDLVYSRPIRDPDGFSGAASGITSLAAHRKILELAKRHGREVWFDVHVGTDGPRPDASFDGMLSFVDALGTVAGGARHKVAVFEFNAGNHAQRRALANALAIQRIERDGRIPIATSANCLQPDGQNDNGWDQGLLFLNPSQVWLQPPGHVTRMISRHYQPLLVPSDVQSPGNALDVTAKRSEDGRVLVLQVVNSGDRPMPAVIRLGGFAPSKATASVEELSGPLGAVNTSESPGRIAPRRVEWRHTLAGGAARYTFAPHGFTVIRLE